MLREGEKRGGDDVRLSLDAVNLVATDENSVDLIALDQALMRLAELDEQQARVVELRYFGGLSLEETAEVLRISRATTARDWEVAKAWLRRELTR
jgi:RNA polymerase sigma factor (TIGR02999 family)